MINYCYLLRLVTVLSIQNNDSGGGGGAARNMMVM